MLLFAPDPVMVDYRGKVIFSDCENLTLHNKHSQAWCNILMPTMYGVHKLAKVLALCVGINNKNRDKENTFMKLGGLCRRVKSFFQNVNKYSIFFLFAVTHFYSTGPRQSACNYFITNDLAFLIGILQDRFTNQIMTSIYAHISAVHILSRA